MGGIRFDFGSSLLNTLTCNSTDMFNNGTDTRRINQVEYTSSGRTDSSDIIVEFLSYKYNSIFKDIIKQSYLGLLAEKPQYYMGNNSELAHKAKQVIAIEKNETQPITKNFLNVHEVPNHSHNGQLSNTPSSNNNFWPEYSRALLAKLAYNSESKQYFTNLSNMSGAIIETEYEIKNEVAYPTHLLINKNTAGLFLGENTLTKPWPTIRHFGLFRNPTDEGNNMIHLDYTDKTTFYYIEESPDLYFWGELSENNNWYHLTEDSEYNELKTYYKNTAEEGQTPKYEVWTGGSVGWIKSQMYEKLGIIIHQNESAAFGVGEFKLIFENNTFTLGTTGG